MNNVKIFHMADVHLDAPFSSLSPTEAELARRSLRSAFVSALFTAKNRGVDIFLIAGDLFDSEYVTPETRDFLCAKLSEYKEMRFFIAPGNHDPYTDSSPYATMPLPENVHVFRGKGAAVIKELGVAVYGVGFTSAETTESPLSDLPELDKSLINIMVCHGDLGASSSVYGPISKDEIARSGFDYIALGHIHKTSGVLEEGGVHYAYSGCTEGRGFDETGDKGALIGTVSKGEVSLSFLSLARRKYAVETIDTSNVESRAELIEAIRKAMIPYGYDTHLRVVLTGSPKAVISVGAEFFETGGSNPMSLEIKDKSTPRISLTKTEGETTLLGVFTRRMQNKLDTLPADSKEREIYAAAMRMGLLALDGRDVTGV